MANVTTFSSRLSGKVCVVFGGSSGIGKSICELFASHGASVAVIGRNRNKAADTVDILNTLKRTIDEQQHAASYVCNVTDPDLVQKTIMQIESELGSVDILVNSAGINKDALLLRSKVSDMEAVIQTNLLGSMYGCKAVLRSMIQRRQGAIVNIGSVVGIKGNVGQTIYSATKSGLIGFTKSLSKEVLTKGISVNLVAPGLIATDMTAYIKDSTYSKYKDMIPIGRFGCPSEVANVVLFLVQSPFITGQVIVVDGGLHLSL